MRIITYATHAEGKFKSLVENEYGVKIDVLGWGSKWNGFMDKFKGVIKFLNEIKDDNEIIVFIDGFDSIINKNISDLEETFKSLDCKVLLSKNTPDDTYPVMKEIFGTCKNNVIANSGMYMGYAGNLKKVLEKSLSFKCKDDQRILNSSCSYFDFIKVDTDEIIFQNISPPPFKSDKSKKPFFKSFPGSLNVKRIRRAITNEYPQYFINVITSTCLVLMYMYPNWSPYIFMSFIIYYYIMDHSCVV